MNLLHRPLNENSSIEDVVTVLRLLPPFGLPDGAHAWTNVRSGFQQLVRESVGSRESAVALPGSGRGIVTCGGGEKYFPSVYVMLRRLRELGCELPVEVWHLGKEEMDPTMERLVRDLGGRTIDAHDLVSRIPWRILKGWELKPYAICYSEFKEVLFLDADCVPLVDPTPLFSSRGYTEKGAVFWPDFTSWTLEAWVWQAFGLEAPPDDFGGKPLVPKGNDWMTFGKPIPDKYDVPIESGQLLVDKVRCGLPLRIAGLLCEYSDLTFQWVHGDKEMFRMAWKYCERSYHRPSRFPGWDTHTYLHYDPDKGDELLFAHRTQDKLRVGANGNRRGTGSIPHESRLFELTEELEKFWEGKPWALTRSSVGLRPISVVTALFDLGQTEDRQKDLRHYLEQSRPVFEVMQGCDITVYTQPHLAELVRSIAPQASIVSVNLEDFEAYKRLEDVRRSREFHPLRSANPRKDTPLYAIFQQMKIEIIRKHAVEHDFPVWIDLGISSTAVGQALGFSKAISLKKLRIAIEKGVTHERVFFLLNDEPSRIQDWQTIRHAVLFGVFGGPAKHVNVFLEKVQERYRQLQEINFVPHDEVVVEDVAAEHPTLTLPILSRELDPKDEGETWAERFAKAKLEVSMAGYYIPEQETKNLAKRWCFELAIDRSVVSWIRDTARGNLPYYASSAEIAIGAKPFATLTPSCRANFVPTNPSVCAWDGKIFAIIRSVNYTITEHGSYVVRDLDNIMRTENIFVELDSEGQILHEIPVVDAIDPKTRFRSNYEGFEDCRLFRWRNAWWASATVLDRSSDNTARIALLCLKVENDRAEVITCRLISGPQIGRPEKNWMPVISKSDELLFVYSCDPTLVIDDQGRTRTFHTPRFACDRMSGSSQLLPHEDGYLAVVHESNHKDDKKEYLHRIIRFDHDFQVEKIGSPFFFERLGIEFCAGLTKHGDRLLFSYGSEDREAKIVSSSIHDIEKYFDR